MAFTKSSHLDADAITRHISGKRVSHVTRPDEKHLVIHFADGSTLVVERQGLAVRLGSVDPAGESPAAGVRPTPRQREYLEFIKRYILRFGISPAESDIQRHFLVSAPTVNQMVQTLERRGFIMRQPGVPRSIRIVDGY